MTEVDARDFGRIEGKLDAAISLLENFGARQEGQEVRIRTLETGRARHIGFMAGISAGISAVVTSVGLFLKTGGV